MDSFFKFDTQLLLQAFGLVFIVIGVTARLGMWKQWYWRSKSSIYGYIPLGVIFLLYSYNDQAKQSLEDAFWIYQLLYAGPIAVAIWWVARPSAFVKPDWVRWVEAYPQETVRAMQQAAENDPDWESHVTSPENLERWARSLEKARPGSKAKVNTRR